MKEQIHDFLLNLVGYAEIFQKKTSYELDKGGAESLAISLSRLDFWQPIETAPTDGTWIQGWSNEIYHLGYITMTGSDFWSADNYNPVFPTHWMPVPNPPKNGRSLESVG